MYEIYEALLIEKKLNNSKVSKATGVPNSTLSDWKKGKNNLKYENLEKIASFLDTTAEFLKTGNYDYRFPGKIMHKSDMILDAKHQKIYDNFSDKQKIAFKQIVNSIIDNLSEF